jgi:phospholipid/cholesterol/gamma-HCH transport system substrate-binding protein
MESKAKYTYVGLAVIALVTALTIGIIWLNHSGSRADFNYYTIYFERQPLDGLQIGADVDMRGIKVGRVEDYALIPTNINRVRVVIRIDRRTPVSTNTVAIVTRNFVTGIAKISLVTPSPPGPQLAEVLPEERYAVIPEGESNLDAIAGRLNRVGDIAAEALQNVNDVLRKENRDAFDVTLRNLRDLSSALNARMAQLDKTMTAFTAAANELARAGSRVGQLADTTGAQLPPTLRQAEQTLKDVSSAAAALQTQVTLLSQQLNSTVASTDDQLTLAVGELRTTMDSLNRVLDKFQDPRAALLGPSKAQRGPGE